MPRIEKIENIIPISIPMRYPIVITTIMLTIIRNLFRDVKKEINNKTEQQKILLIKTLQNVSLPSHNKINSLSKKSLSDSPPSYLLTENAPVKTLIKNMDKKTKKHIP